MSKRYHAPDNYINKTAMSRMNCVREKVQTAGFPFTKDCFDLGPHFLDGVQITAVGRKVQQSYTFRFQNLPDSFSIAAIARSTVE